MSQNQELDFNQTEKKETRVDRVLCHIDSQIPLKLDVLAKYFTNKLCVPVVSMEGRLAQRNFLQQTDQINNKDFFVFFIKIVNTEQINELYGTWRKISAKKAKLLLIIFDYLKPSSKGVSDNLSAQRYLEIGQDQKTKIILVGRDKLNAKTLGQAIEQITNN